MYTHTYVHTHRGQDKRTHTHKKKTCARPGTHTQAHTPMAAQKKQNNPSLPSSFCYGVQLALSPNTGHTRDKTTLKRLGEGTNSPPTLPTVGPRHKRPTNGRQLTPNGQGDQNGWLIHPSVEAGHQRPANLPLTRPNSRGGSKTTC